MIFSTRIYAAPQGREVNSATFYFNKSVVINNTIRQMNKLNTKIFHSNKIAESFRGSDEKATFWSRLNIVRQILFFKGIISECLKKFIYSLALLIFDKLENLSELKFDEP